jgi:hypothetical protein
MNARVIRFVAATATAAVVSVMGAGLANAAVADRLESQITTATGQQNTHTAAAYLKQLHDYLQGAVTADDVAAVSAAIQNLRPVLGAVESAPVERAAAVLSDRDRARPAWPDPPRADHRAGDVAAHDGVGPGHEPARRTAGAAAAPGAAAARVARRADPGAAGARTGRACSGRARSRRAGAGPAGASAGRARPAGRRTGARAGSPGGALTDNFPKYGRTAVIPRGVWITAVRQFFLYAVGRNRSTTFARDRSARPVRSAPAASDTASRNRVPRFTKLTKP